MQSLTFFVVLSLAVAASAQTRPATPQSKPAAAKPATQSQAKPAVPAPAKAAEPSAPKAEATTATAPADPNQVVMTVGTEKITAKEFEAFIQGLPDQYKTAAQGPMKRQIAEQYAQVRLMAGEARRRGLDHDPVVTSQMQFQNDNLLAGALFKRMQEDVKIDDAALRKSYEDRKTDFEELRARHILIRFKGSPIPNREGKAELTEEQALAKATELRKKIAAGEDFAKLAKDESDDAGSGANGGDLGNFHKGQMVPEFEKAAFALPAGQISEPIKTQFGYHLIKVEKHEVKSFDDVKPELEKTARPQAAREAAEKLRANAGLKLDDAYFGPAQPAPAAPAPGAAKAVVTPTPGQTATR